MPPPDTSSQSPPPPACDSSFLEVDPPPSAPAPVLIVLNYELPALTARLWGRACLTVCADGGANRLYDAAPTWLPHAPSPDAARAALAPGAIVGDLDSVRADVRAFYGGTLSVPVVDLGADQDTTDLVKCLQYAAGREGVPASAPRVALGALGGRLDHTLAALSLLFSPAHASTLVLVGDGCVARRVPAGVTTLTPVAGVEGPACGLVALSAAPVPVTTKGLAWNLDGGAAAGGQGLALGGLQSTSNAVVGENVTVESGGDLLWTTTLRGEDA